MGPFLYLSYCLPLHLGDYFVDGHVHKRSLWSRISRIEYWIEGDAPAQRRLAKALGQQKIGKKALKLIIFTLSLLIANTVMAYGIALN